MKKIVIQDLTPGLVEGVAVQLPPAQPGYRETYRIFDDKTICRITAGKGELT
jgi:hypothetical protein